MGLGTPEVRLQVIAIVFTFEPVFDDVTGLQFELESARARSWSSGIGSL